MNSVVKSPFSTSSDSSAFVREAAYGSVWAAGVSAMRASFPRTAMLCGIEIRFPEIDVDGSVGICSLAPQLTRGEPDGIDPLPVTRIPIEVRIREYHPLAHRDDDSPFPAG